MNVLITGCGSGIGQHLARELLKRGERVCATDINGPALETLRAQAAQPEQLWLETLDVRDAAAWDRLVEQLATRWGRLDVLMNVAGYLKPGYVEQNSADEVHRHLDINAKGVIFGTQSAARQMLKQGGGHIINIASLAGIAPVPGLNLYSASKFAVRGYTLAVAQELRPRGIKVTVICPDAVQTPMLDLQVNYEQAALTFSGGQVLTVENIADAVLNRALRKAPLEITLPSGRGRLAKLASCLPDLNALLLDLLLRKGRAAQQKLRG